jgi:hypothetical protein
VSLKWALKSMRIFSVDWERINFNLRIARRLQIWNTRTDKKTTHLLIMHSFYVLSTTIHMGDSAAVLCPSTVLTPPQKSTPVFSFRRRRLPCLHLGTSLFNAQHSRPTNRCRLQYEWLEQTPRTRNIIRQCSTSCKQNALPFWNITMHPNHREALTNV